MHILKWREPQLARIARRNRQEILKAGLTRRDLAKLGLLSASGYLITKAGLSVRAQHSCGPGVCALGCSPPTLPFKDPLVIPPVLPERNPATDPGFQPPPTTAPNRAINPATGIPFEGRTQSHQFRDRFPAEKFFITRMAPNAAFKFSEDPTNLVRIGPQLIWGFNKGGADFTVDPALTPGPIIVARYGHPTLVRRYNALTGSNGGFGVPEVSTHLHNFHSGPDSDGGPCDPTTGGNSTDPLQQGRFFFLGQYYDYFQTLARAGFDTDAFRATNGDVRETLTTLWYHDHRVDHTAENVYKGLAGFELLFNDFDTGSETDPAPAFRLPGFVQGFDIPLILNDKLFTPEGEICFDTFGLDGLVGDKYVVNGRLQPFFTVQRRRYRFRILDGGPSRFYELFLTNPLQPSMRIPFWAITTTDGNFLPRPVEFPGSYSRSPAGLRLGVAERCDVIIDFKRIWQLFGSPTGTLNIWLENLLDQTSGLGPESRLLDPGEPDGRNALVQFQIVGPTPASDPSFDPQPVAFPNVACSPNDCIFTPICLPPLPTDNAPAQENRIRITRTFDFDRVNGQWVINGRLVDCSQFRFAVQRNSAERWILRNGRRWQHPVHIHLEEFRIIRRNRNAVTCGDVEFGRKDVVRLNEDDEVELIMRFRDFLGGYPMHCHNLIHEDHAMMLLWQVAATGDNNTQP